MTTRFVDQATLQVEAGRGGKGCRSFYRDLWTRNPIPDGGDGGRGGHVVIRANRQLTTLFDFLTRRTFRAAKGGNASSKKKHGAQGTDCVIEVPLGTIAWDAATGDRIRELLDPGDEVIVARGGAGGVGNASQAKSRARSPGDSRFKGPDLSLEGAAGERRTLRLELKLIADVGIVGMPNAGKSTLIRQISGARPRVAAFPFTTTSPVLGAVSLPTGHRFVAVDVPGLMEGAHRGRGLGLDFLRHIERTRMLVHLVDMAGVDGRDPVIDYATLLNELKAYLPEVAAKRQIVVANKMDLPQAKENLIRFRKKSRVQILPLSAKTGKGISTLLEKISGDLS